MGELGLIQLALLPPNQVGVRIELARHADGRTHGSVTVFDFDTDAVEDCFVHPFIPSARADDVLRTLMEIALERLGPFPPPPGPGAGATGASASAESR